MTSTPQDVMKDRRTRIQLLDGGMGTSLQAAGHDVTSYYAMYGAGLLASNPEAIRAVHRGFIDAGVDIVETATHELTASGLTRAGLTSESARATMRKAVDLASTSPDRQICLALGPLGATVKPGQDYGGFYPPPYGPGPDDPSNHCDDPEAENALVAWHLERLRVYASDDTTWRKVGWVGFETIPLTREIRAIRRAMGQLSSELRQRYGEGNDRWWKKPFWVTSAYPEGRYPQLLSDGSHVGVNDVLRALLGTLPSPAATPEGIGIKCSHPSFVSALASDLRSALDSFISAKEVSHEVRLIFVLYPDGGHVYDPVTQQWTEKQVGPDGWAEQVWSTAEELESTLNANGKSFGAE